MTERGPAYWDARYAAGDQLWNEGPHPEVVALVTTLSRERATPGRAVDLGAGDGRHAIWLARAGWVVTAVDYSAQGIARACGHAREAGVEVDWVVADVAQWAPSELVDLVLLSYFHLEDDQLARVCRWLTPGGHVLVVSHGPPGPDRCGPDRCGPDGHRPTGSDGRGPRDPRYRKTVESLRDTVLRLGIPLEVLVCREAPRCGNGSGSDIVLLAQASR